MSRTEQDQQALQRVTLGNPEAIRFLELWRQYVHFIDDLVDVPFSTADRLLHTFALAIELYSHPFYLRNIGALKQLARNITNAYHDSVSFEAEEAEPWQKQWSDHNRHVGAEMVLAVASICAEQRGLDPYAHMRSFSLELRTICWMEHHTAGGEAI